jgi:hypothetical protein
MSTAHKDSLDDDLKGKYLKAVDIEEIQPVAWTIAYLEKQPVGTDGEVKRCVIFNESEKPLIMNVTATKTLRGLYGSDPEKLKGKKVTLFNTYADFNGTTHRVIRIAPDAPKKQTSLLEEFGEKEDGDDIPM